MDFEDEEMKEYREKAFNHLEENFNIESVFRCKNFLDRINQILPEREELENLCDKVEEMICCEGGSSDDIDDVWEIAETIESVMMEIEELAGKITDVMGELTEIPCEDVD